MKVWTVLEDASGMIPEVYIFFTEREAQACFANAVRVDLQDDFKWNAQQGSTPVDISDWSDERIVEEWYSLDDHGDNYSRIELHKKPLPNPQ